MTTTTASADITESGVYPALAEEAYHRHPALSSSGARKLLPPSCPAKFRWAQDHPEPPRPVLNLGRAAHQQVLGTGAELVVIDAEDYRTKAAKEDRDAAWDAGLTPLLTAEHDQVVAMAAALRAHPRAGLLFAPDRGEAEQSLFWIDRRTGVMCRARLDWLPNRADRRLIIAEYKTSRSASPLIFPKDFHNFGYFIQGVFYLEAATALGLCGDYPPALVFVVQEKDPPYLVTVFEPDAESLRAGRIEMRQAIEIFAHCTEIGHWPGYSDEIELVSLPAYAARQYQEGTL